MVKVQEVVNLEMIFLIAQLKTQREETERRLGEAKQEATKLQLEKDADKWQIIELETRKNKNENRLDETHKEAKMAQATAVVETAS